MIKTKKRYFKDSKKYFKFINGMKDKIRVIMVKPLKDTIKVEYVNIEMEGCD